MSDTSAETDDAANAATRLEAALERIAASLVNINLVQTSLAEASPPPSPGAEAPPEIRELTARLDGIIARLREGLAEKPT